MCVCRWRCGSESPLANLPRERAPVRNPSGRADRWGFTQGFSHRGFSSGSLHESSHSSFDTLVAYPLRPWGPSLSPIQVLAHLKLNDPVLQLAMELEKIALTDEYFVKRNLYPNVDFYSGICLRAMGVPVSMFTVLFAVARTVGWCSQWCARPLTRVR